MVWVTFRVYIVAQLGLHWPREIHCAVNWGMVIEDSPKDSALLVFSAYTDPLEIHCAVN